MTMKCLNLIHTQRFSSNWYAGIWILHCITSYLEIMQMYSQHLWQKLRKLILFYYKNSVNSTHHMFELVSRIFSTHIRIALCAQCGNYGNLLSRFFDKNFVKVTFLLKKILKSWFDEIFFWGDSKFFFFPHCDCER